MGPIQLKEKGGVLSFFKNLTDYLNQGISAVLAHSIKVFIQNLLSHGLCVSLPIHIVQTIVFARMCLMSMPNADWFHMGLDFLHDCVVALSPFTGRTNHLPQDI